MSGAPNYKKELPAASGAATAVNVAQRLSEMAQRRPRAVAVAVPPKRGRGGRAAYQTITFADLDEQSRALAVALLASGMQPGMRIVLLVPPGIEFFTLVFAMFRAGLVTVLIDPGMGRKNLVQCLSEVHAEGFIAIPKAQAMRLLLRSKFPEARWNVTVGRRWFWGGPTLAQLQKRQTQASDPPLPMTQASDPAAIIFTSGGTGPPKGVLYTHGNFAHQVTEIRDFYGIQEGEIDLPGFPLFGLFNAAMGVTTVVPQMDFSRPARVDPRKILQAAADWQVTQSFGSPAIWNAVGKFCEQHEKTIPTLRRVLSAGAPVPVHVLKRMRGAIHPEGQMHTPYGATEALPVASIEASEVLSDTAAKSARGAGTCVGRRFPGIQWRVIAISDTPIATIAEAPPLPDGKIGELIVRGPVVTREYVTRPEANRFFKISDDSADGLGSWHRMGDLGYLDEQGRFWFCGRKAHRVTTKQGIMFTIPCEAIFNAHPRVFRSALVGTGPAGHQEPAVVVETWPERRVSSPSDERQLLQELRDLALTSELTRSIGRFFVHGAFPVDVRHNAKIARDRLAEWVVQKLEKA